MAAFQTRPFAVKKPSSVKRRRLAFFIYQRLAVTGVTESLNRASNCVKASSAWLAYITDGPAFSTWAVSNSTWQRLFCQLFPAVTLSCINRVVAIV
jgi:hypothetical protein